MFAEIFARRKTPAKRAVFHPCFRISYGRSALFFLICCTALTAVECGKNHINPLWKMKLKSRVYADAIVDAFTVYLFSQAGEAIAAELKTGKKLWDIDLGDAILATPASSRTQLFIVTQNGHVYSIDKKKGNIRWKYKYDDLFIAPLTMAGNDLLLPSERGTLYTLSATNGSEIWKFSGQEKFNARAAVSGNNILIGGWAKRFFSLRKDGRVNWSFQTSEICSSDPLVIRNTVIVPVYDQFVYALDVQTGKLLWRQPAEHPSNIVLWKDQIVFASGKDLKIVSPLTGETTNTVRFGRIISKLYSHNRRLYLLSDQVYALNDSGLRTSLLFRLPDPVFSLSFGSGMIIAVDRLYSIYGYGTEEQV